MVEFMQYPGDWFYRRRGFVPTGRRPRQRRKPRFTSYARLSVGLFSEQRKAAQLCSRAR
jgi:hypothetical protein